MAERVVIKCPQPDNPKYVDLFKSWKDEMDKRYAQVNTFINDMNECALSKIDAIDSTLDMLKTFKLDFQNTINPWLIDLNDWLADGKDWLASVKAVNVKGDEDMTEWETWFADMEAWIGEVNNWYTQVLSVLDDLITQWENSSNAWKATDETWRANMQEWLEGWPVGEI